MVFIDYKDNFFVAGFSSIEKLTEFNMGPDIFRLTESIETRPGVRPSSPAVSEISKLKSELKLKQATTLILRSLKTGYTWEIKTRQQAITNPFPIFS